MLHRLSNVLASIDGGEATTDGYRGRGIYRQVLKNLRVVHEQVGGSITARVTWGNADTSFEELDALLAEDSPFDYLYWQFVADEMYAEGRLDKRKAVLRQLVDRFFSRTDALYPGDPAWASCATSCSRAARRSSMAAARSAGPPPTCST